MTREEYIKQKAIEYVNGAQPGDAFTIRLYLEIGANRADKSMIEKASRWIATHLLAPGQDQLLDEFKQAMKEDW